MATLRDATAVAGRNGNPEVQADGPAGGPGGPSIRAPHLTQCFLGAREARVAIRPHPRGPFRCISFVHEHTFGVAPLVMVPETQLFDPAETPAALRRRPAGQLLKWVGNKYRYAEAIAQHLPEDLGTYYEPFVGTGAVLATLAPTRAVAGDALPMLVQLLQLVQTDPGRLVDHYAANREELLRHGRDAYERIKARYNNNPSPDDLLVISRSCYGGVMRFTRTGYLSTPMGPHKPMPADKLARYMVDWRQRLAGTEFVRQDFVETIALAGQGDTVYCDPPYLHGQSILYGAQDFRLSVLWQAVEMAVERGARVAVSADGYRRSGLKCLRRSTSDSQMGCSPENCSSSGAAACSVASR
jgi:DNA adenine methylase